MIVLTPTQTRIYKYIKEEKFKSWEVAKVDLQLSKSTLWNNIKVMEAGGVVVRLPMYEVV